MANTYLEKTFSTTGTSTTKFTFSAWFKLSSSGRLITAGTSTRDGLVVNSNGTLQFFAGSNSPEVSPFVTNRLFRDTSAWYHIVVSADSTQSGASNQTKLYVNGVQETSFSTQEAVNINNAWYLGSNIRHRIGTDSGTLGTYFNGSMSHIHFIDGTAYDATAFGEYDANGVWKIKTDVSVTYGTNGFFILKDGNSVTDQSGNGNNFTVGGGTLTNTEDSPSNVFATLNPLDIDTALSYTFAKGNTDVTIAESGGEGMSKGTLGVSSGKYYWECKLVSSSVHGRFGVVSTATPSTVNPGEFGIAWQMNDATMQLVNSVVSGSWGSNPSNNDILMFALDCDNQAFYFGVNGTWRNSGNPTSGASRTGGVNYSGQSTLTSDFLTVGFGGNFFGGGGVQQGQYNFGNGYFGTTAVSSAGTNASGNGIFEYDVPTGYTALSTKGLNL